MINNKKKINKIKTETFLNEFPTLFLLQHNNFTIQDWFDFRQKLQEIEITVSNQKELVINQQNSLGGIEIFNVKNSILKMILTDLPEFRNESSKNFKYICQGPNFIIGFKNQTHMKPLWSFINSNPKLVFISCFCNKKLLNHLDVETLLETDISIYSKFLENLDKKTHLSSTLESTLQLNPLIYIQSELIMSLYLLKEFNTNNKTDLSI